MSIEREAHEIAVAAAEQLGWKRAMEEAVKIAEGVQQSYAQWGASAEDEIGEMACYKIAARLRAKRAAGNDHDV